jgi:hypothetical protein
MTICSVLQNVVVAAKRFYEESVSRKIATLPLKPLRPVPSDIDIARAAMPKHIKDLSHEIGILDHEVELYGMYKAKVGLDIMERLGHRRDGHYVYVTGYCTANFVNADLSALLLRLWARGRVQQPLAWSRLSLLISASFRLRA